MRAFRVSTRNARVLGFGDLLFWIEGFKRHRGYPLNAAVEAFSYAGVAGALSSLLRGFSSYCDIARCLPLLRTGSLLLQISKQWIVLKCLLHLFLQPPKPHKATPKPMSKQVTPRSCEKPRLCWTTGRCRRQSAVVCSIALARSRGRRSPTVGCKELWPLHNLTIREHAACSAFGCRAKC